MKWLFIALALFFIVITVLPVVRHDYWVIRSCDFPRQQIAVLGVVLLGVYIFAWNTRHLVEDIILGLLTVAVVYQVYWIWPYTPFARKQSVSAVEQRPGDQLTVLVANVWIENRDIDAFMTLVRRTDPDLVLALETDDWWAEQLQTLEETHPNAVQHPLGNAYGIALYARYPLHEAEVRFIVQDDVPSIRAWVELPSGRRVRFYGVHPCPPHPEENVDTVERDAELLIVGHEVEADLEEESDVPVVVAGDFNDVPWSYITVLFHRISGLLDPRIGRGTYNTFHAHYPFYRCPLDHVFHSDHFTLARFERSPYFGSDHFALLVRLQLEERAPEVQSRPFADSRMRRHAREEIVKAERRVNELERKRPRGGDYRDRAAYRPYRRRGMKGAVPCRGK